MVNGLEEQSTARLKIANFIQRANKRETMCILVYNYYCMFC